MTTANPYQLKSPENNIAKFLIQNRNQQIKLSVVSTKHILTTPTDLIVVSVDTSSQPINKESKQLLNDTLINELKLSTDGGMLVMTKKTGQLKTKSLIACVIWLEEEVPLLYGCLEKCEQESVHKLALSLIGPETTKDWQTNKLIDSHLNTLVDHFAHTPSSIKELLLFNDKQNTLIFNKLISLSRTPNSSISLDTKPITPIQLQVDEPMRLKSNIEVVYSSIIDDSLHCDVIVNSTNSNLNLSNGLVSASILKAAGDSIQTELKTSYPKGLTETANLAVSSAGNLKNKKHIFHCFLPGWSAQNVKIQIKDIIFTLLNETVKLNLKSIAFPAFGSGNLGYPKSEVPKMMFEHVDEYFEEYEPDIKVYFVIFEKDVETVKAFKDYMADIDNGTLNESFKLEGETIDVKDEDEDDVIEMDTSETTPKNFYKNFKSNEKKHECSLDFDSVTVRAYQANITEAQADVIFNPTDSDLHLDGNISKSLAAVWGDQILNELKTVSGRDCVVWTSGGNLKCKKLIHVDVRSGDMKKAIVRALKEVNEKGFTSLTMPVVGTGVMASDVKESIVKILNSIERFVTNEMKTVCKLKQNDVCVYVKDDYMRHFLGEMQKRAKSKDVPTNQSKSLLGSLFSLITAGSSSSAAKPTTPPVATAAAPSHTFKSFVNTPTKQTIEIDDLHMGFKLISDNQDKLNKVKQTLKDIVYDEIKKDEFTNDYLKHLDVKTLTVIESHCNTKHVRLDWNLQLSRVTLTGRLTNINECGKFIMDKITEYTKKEQNKVSAELTAHKIQWEYEKNNKWIAFNIYLNNQIEQKYQRVEKKIDADSTTEILSERDQKFIVDVVSMKQLDKQNRNKR